MAAQPSYPRWRPSSPSRPSSPIKPLPSTRKMTVEEWHTLEQESEVKHEYIDGEIRAMAGGNDDHTLIAANLIAYFKPLLRGKPCFAYPSDMAVRVSPTRYVYPDVTISCEPREPREPKKPRKRVLLAPCVIFEVLSDSTEKHDKTSKVMYYTNIPSVQEYVLISTERQHVIVHHRKPDQRWEAQVYGPNDVIMLSGIGIGLPVSEIYDEI